MNKTWLLFDVNNLAHRAFYVMEDMSYRDMPTGVLFGFLRDILNYQERWSSKDCVFSFDLGESLRSEVYPSYKKNRNKHASSELGQDAIDAKKDLYQQIFLLRTQYLEGLGFANILAQEGYEADDLIASVCRNLPKGDGAVILSTDKDLYQLLNPQVMMWHPSKGGITYKSFQEKYGIEPQRWPEVKALSGCSTDNIMGIEGVGDKTAIKYLRGELKSGERYHKILLEQERLYDTNMPLVKLPYEGTKVFELKESKTTEKKWRTLTKKLGMKSLLGKHGT